MSTKARWNLLFSVKRQDVSVHAWTREDFERLAAWPSYPPPFEAFDMRCRTMTPAQRDAGFRDRNHIADRMDLIIDHAQQKTVGWIGLVEIDWKAKAVGNMGIRIHPDWCDRDIGAIALTGTTEWCFEHDIRTLRLDVAATNPRAIRCYEKCGYAITGEFWRSDPMLTPEKLAQPQYESLRPHVRFEDGVAEIRFYWMEIGSSV